MASGEEDERFQHISKDPKFKRIPYEKRKVKIDKRFQSMFKDEKFKVKYSVDKRGFPIKPQTNVEDFKKFYNLDSKDKESSLEESEEEEEEEDEGVNSDASVDYARGIGVKDDMDSSSDEESSEGELEEDKFNHAWGELDQDAERTDEVTHRLAVMHMDWDRIKAKDLMVLFNSFLPQGGSIHSVTIYPSEFGKQRMAEEEVKGPLELVEQSEGEDSAEEESTEGNAYHREKLRQYQLNRLKYYYAVVVFDSAESANKVYTECDGMEYESSATRVDLRFVPDDTEFDEESKESCTELPDLSKYKPRNFMNSALQQVKVNLTWDETDPDRVEAVSKLMSGDVDEANLKTYLATSSEEEDYYIGAATGEVTLNLSRKAFDSLRLRPRMMRNVSDRDSGLTVLGTRYRCPVGIAPSAMQKLAHADGEVATARAAGMMDAIMILSLMSTTSLEEVRAQNPSTTLWLQMYIFKDRALSLQMVQRAERSGYSAIVITMDTAVLGSRYRDLKNKFTMPPYLSLANFRNLKQHNEDISKFRDISGEECSSGLTDYIANQFDESVDWDDVRSLVQATKLPIVCKGILTGEDAIMCHNVGAKAIIVSNHGGRQLDQVPATIQALPEIVEAVGNSMEVYLDGGIRYGTDVFKAIGLGAKYVFVGRAALWGLAHSGSNGVAKILQILHFEFDQTLALCGCTSAEDITRDMIVHESYYEELLKRATWQAGQKDNRRSKSNTSKACSQDNRRSKSNTSKACNEDETPAGLEPGTSDLEAESKQDVINKYRNLLKSIGDEENKKKNDVELEISWGVGLEERTKELMKEKEKNKEELTPFQQLLAKKKEKRKKKREEKEKKAKENGGEEDDDDIPSDVDLSDPYFREEIDAMKAENKKAKSKLTPTPAPTSSPDNSDDENAQANLELLLMDEQEDKKHFNMKDIVEREKEGKKKKKKKSMKNYKKKKMEEAKMGKSAEDDFELDVADSRFSAVFTSHHFNIDPADPHFQKTKAMQALIQEKQKRRRLADDDEPAPEVRPKKKR
ncbi:hypothetical protein M8J75_007435 [Diaphorina citri]|nr:hypothetical protein M8J75_007435 [Diaphorina citri]